MSRVPRPRTHDTDEILDAARGVVLAEGVRAATLDRIVRVSGAPKGSIYHRFPTLADLLGAMWIRAVHRSQGAFLAALDADPPGEAAVAAGLAIFDFARTDADDARLLAALRREDLVREVSDPALASALATLNGPIAEALTRLARRLHGRAGRAVVERTTLAVVDLPQGAIRRHLLAGEPLPPGARRQLEAAIRAALAAA
jgi:AcrR family transcriptional regulator